VETAYLLIYGKLPTKEELSAFSESFTAQAPLHEDMLNFFDRISFKYTLNPFNFDETKEMIDFRIRQAGYKANMHLFLIRMGKYLLMVIY